MEFLSRQAWDISAHLISIRYTTLESLQKELKGNWVLNRHSGKMLGGKKIPCCWESAIILMQFRLFKDSSSKQEVTVPVCLLGRRKQERSQTLIACFRKNEAKTISGRIGKFLLIFLSSKKPMSDTFCCSYLCFESFVSKDAHKKILYKSFTESPWFLFAK